MTIADDIERLHALRDRGALSDAEFAQAKARVLGETRDAGGTTGGAGATVQNSFLHRLHRSTTDRVIGGVCGGLGAHTNLPSWAWRVIFSVAILYFGIGLITYLLLWLFIPATPAQAV